MMGSAIGSATAGASGGAQSGSTNTGSTSNQQSAPAEQKQESAGAETPEVVDEMAKDAGNTTKDAIKKENRRLIYEGVGKLFGR